MVRRSSSRRTSWGEVQRLCSRVAIIKEGSILKVEDIKTLQRDNYKRIRVVAEGVDQKRFDVPGVSNLVAENGTIRFFYKGDINVITRLISEIPVMDVSIEEPTLEEIFLHYYE